MKKIMAKKKDDDVRRSQEVHNKDRLLSNKGRSEGPEASALDEFKEVDLFFAKYMKLPAGKRKPADLFGRLQNTC